MNAKAKKSEPVVRELGGHTYQNGGKVIHYIAKLGPRTSMYGVYVPPEAFEQTDEANERMIQMAQEEFQKNLSAGMKIQEKQKAINEAAQQYKGEVNNLT